MHVRRALLLFAIVLGLAALTASLSRPGEEDPRSPRRRPAASRPRLARRRLRPLGARGARLRRGRGRRAGARRGAPRDGRGDRRRARPGRDPAARPERIRGAAHPRALRRAALRVEAATSSRFTPPRATSRGRPGRSTWSRTSEARWAAAALVAAGSWPRAARTTRPLPRSSERPARAAHDAGRAAGPSLREVRCRASRAAAEAPAGRILYVERVDPGRRRRRSFRARLEGTRSRRPASR